MTEKGSVVIKHGEITNLGMPAMAMEFEVANKKMLNRTAAIMTVLGKPG